jgi:hypothetical protein
VRKEKYMSNQTRGFVMDINGWKRDCGVRSGGWEEGGLEVGRGEGGRIEEIGEGLEFGIKVEGMG